MKATIEVDLSEVFVSYENDSADFSAAIEQAIIDHIIKTKASLIQNTINEKIQEALGNFVEKILDEKIDKMLNNFLEEAIIISDGYKKTSYNSLLDYVEDKMKRAYGEKLSGKACTQDLLTTKISNIIQKRVSDDISNAIKKVEIEGKKIAKKTIETNSTMIAIQNMLEVK